MLIAGRATMLEAMCSQTSGRAIDPSDPVLLHYLQASMGALLDETLRILFLDASRHLIADEQLQQGTISQLTLYPRTLFRRALELNATAVILVHNHPSGDPTPSEADVAATRLLVGIGRSLDVDVLEHIVVTASGHARMLHRRSKASPTSPVTLRSANEPTDAARALSNARRTLRRRQLRRQLVGSDELFGEPAWDMLIDLFIHAGEARPVSTSSLCIASGQPMSTALRLLQRLCDAQLVTRTADREDGRRNFIRLAPNISHRLTAYFAEGDE